MEIKLTPYHTCIASDTTPVSPLAMDPDAAPVSPLDMDPDTAPVATRVLPSYLTEATTPVSPRVAHLYPEENRRIPPLYHL